MIRWAELLIKIGVPLGLTGIFLSLCGLVLIMWSEA